MPNPIDMMRILMVTGLLTGAGNCEEVWAQDTVKKGWNWYEKKPVVEETPEEFAQKPIIPEIEDLKKMTPAAIGELMEKQLAFAIVSEEVTEVAEYYSLLDFARRRSRTFTALTNVALLKNPTLNARSSYPVTNEGRTIKSRERKSERDDRLISEGNNFALVMFSSEACGFCKVQWGTLQAFRDRTGWTISTVDIAEYPERAARFNIRATPMTILIRKGSPEWFPISVGVESLPVIADNAYRGIRLLKGEISHQQFLNSESDDGGFFDPVGASSKLEE